MNKMKSKVIEVYESCCKSEKIPFQLDLTVNPYDTTTLFCPAGMQQYKDCFKNPSVKKTIANVQSCIRLNDFEEIGDGTHFLYFNMLGFFSFREKSVQNAIDFFLNFLAKLDIYPDEVSIHPDKMDEWSQYYAFYPVKIKSDSENIWTDGEIGGYCTEFYVKGIEIGNIVNPMGDCIDVGFGLERLQNLIGEKVDSTEKEILISTIEKIIESGYSPSNQKQGYILRKLLRTLNKIGGTIQHPFFEEEIERQEKIQKVYNRLKRKHKDKSKEWWFESVGIDLDEVN